MSTLAWIVASGLAMSAHALPGSLTLVLPEETFKKLVLHWHHCHRPVTAHRPVGSLILVADGLHNLIGGLSVGSAFVLVPFAAGNFIYIAATDLLPEITTSVLRATPA